MAYEDTKNPTVSRAHALTLSERGKLTVTGVDEVLRFDEDEVEMRTARGDLLVRGSGLHVGRLAIDTGEITVDGAVDELVYTDAAKSADGFWARLFG